MKLPKGFGGQGFGGMMAKAQEAMAQAQNLEVELAQERINVERNGVKIVIAGNGDFISLNLDKEIIDPEDKEMLEDLLVAAIRDAFTQATDMRQKRVDAITKNTGLDMGALGM